MGREAVTVLTANYTGVLVSEAVFARPLLCGHETDQTQQASSRRNGVHRFTCLTRLKPTLVEAFACQTNVAGPPYLFLY